VEQEATATESLVVVAETRAIGEAERERLQAAVIDRVATTVGVPPDLVVLVPPGAVPKTSSGKIRRADTKAMYLRGELGRVPGTSAAQKLRLAAAVALQQARRPLRALLRGAYALYLAVAGTSSVLLFWLVAALTPGRRAAVVLQRLGCRIALRLIGCRLSVQGLENLPRRGPALLVCNHASYADVPALLALLPREMRFVAKKEVRRWPLVGLFVRRAGHLTVDRYDVERGKTDVERVSRAVQGGDAVLVFPEATFTRAAGLRPFRLGAFKTAVDTGTPVVPLALRGTRRVLRDGALLPRPGRVHLWVGEPIAAEGSGWKAVVRLRDRVAEAIAAHCGEPRLELVAAGPPRPVGAP
jgi:1-acyl-sn-glycerol-3-phosphate acyltransferase